MVLTIIVGVIVCGYLIVEYTTKKPYEDLSKVAQIYDNSRLKERHSDFQIQSPNDVKFVDMGEKYRVEYGKSNFYLYKETMFDKKVTDLLLILELELKMSKTKGLVIFYKEEIIPTYVDV